MTTTHLKRLLSTKEAAGYLAMTTAALYQLVHRKKIPVVRVGRALRFDLRALDAWIDQQRVPAEVTAA